MRFRTFPHLLKKKAKVASDDEIEDETAVWGNDLLKEDMDDEGGDVPSGQ